MTPAITYAIPFYRKTDLLRAAIESVRSQSRDDWELLVCDDSGIELGVEALVRGFGDERIDYARNRENLGMVETWNRCIAQARTDLVTLLHADDLLLPHY
ncbi:MAG: glycosyltransferase, partial [bacterium]|nr:glycosyltransferase [bacterium]